MLNVNRGHGQADAHLLRMPDGAVIAIDFGFSGDSPGSGLQGLRRAGINHLDALILSHYHRDHYGGITELLDSNITIGVLIHNPPTRPQCERESPWGCTWRELTDLWRRLDEGDVAKRIPVAGDIVYRSCLPTSSTHLEIVCAFDGINTPVGSTDLNDMSIVCRLVHGTQRVLFTGDLNAAVGGYLAANTAFALSADILKLPHHGTEGTVPDSFFDRVHPRAVLVPSPSALWRSQRSARIRHYLESRHIPAYVNGLHGEVQVHLSPDRFTVVPETT